MIGLRFLLITLFFVIFTYSKNNPMIIGFSVVYTVEDEKWEDINNDIKDAIKDKGIVISYTSHARKMLDRTAKTAGFKQNTYANAQIHLFCQASLSHRMIKQNPHIISGCPYSISVYELKSKKDTIYVSYRKYPEEEKAYKSISNLQKDIIEKALDLKE